MKKVLLINQGHTQNIGDQAIMITLEKIIQMKGGDSVRAEFWNYERTFKPIYALLCNKLLLKMSKRTFFIDFFNSRRIEKDLKSWKKNDSFAFAIIGGENCFRQNLSLTHQ